MELRKTEESIDELCIQYEAIRRSPVLLSSLPGGETNQQEQEFVFPEIPLPNEDTDGNNENLVVLSTLGSLCDSIQSLQTRLLELLPKIERFRQRLEEKDAVTGKPRYGEKTQKRVQDVVRKYAIMETHMMTQKPEENATTPTSTEQSSLMIQQLLKQHEQQQHVSQQEQQKQQELERQQLQAKRLEEEQERLRQEQIEMEEQRRRQQQEEEQAALLHQQAEEARERRRQAQVEEQAWVDSIRKGPDGVKEQLVILQQSCDDALEFAVALTSLQTIFQQINAHPEEPRFRRIRRNHEQFQQDIGRWKGGVELLLAAGFELGTIDEVPVYLSKEPNIETDMDGWSKWFDLLKQTLEILNAADAM